MTKGSGVADAEGRQPVAEANSEIIIGGLP